MSEPIPQTSSNSEHLSIVKMDIPDGFQMPDKNHADRAKWEYALSRYVGSLKEVGAKQIKDWNNFYQLTTDSKKVEPNDISFNNSVTRFCQHINSLGTDAELSKDVGLKEVRKFFSQKIKEQIAENGFYSGRPDVKKTLEENPLAAVLANSAILINSRSIDNLAQLIRYKYFSIKDVHSDIASPIDAAYNTILARVEDPNNDKFLAGTTSAYTNLLLDVKRKIKRERRSTRQYGDDESLQSKVESVEGGIGDDFFNKDMVDRLKKLVSSFKNTNSRSVGLLMISSFEENGKCLKIEEMAEQLNLPDGTVKGVIHNIRKRLSKDKEILENYPGVER